ncbi:Homeodomain-like protein [Cynara cardunculus var. scolymus]|uniref:Homeodomain-like protein n=1 Tax=Cynara cardunculus var. scolymus TaxID=59895 RepID=A0A103XRK5_CYNCS|nr:Homeodomain-like protein [Cynara cardunculus var. scolymus]
MTRRCSHCSNNGHNSRTCPNRGLKLFGVRITDGSIRKSASMGNLTHYTGSGSGAFNASFAAAGADLDSPGDTPDHNAAADGYASEDFVAGSSSSRERKKGVPWTEEEHRMFLLGLQKLGKGDWRGIARNYVISRTPTQVASHAQKYFIRQSNMSRRKRRSSLFDIVADDVCIFHLVHLCIFVVVLAGEPVFLDEGNSREEKCLPLLCDLKPLDLSMMASHDYNDGNTSQPETQSINDPMCVPTLEEKEEECESTDSTNSNIVEVAADLTTNLMHQEGRQYCYPGMFPAFIPVAIPFWPGGSVPGPQAESHKVLKPTAVHSKNPINVDELVGLSKLSLGKSTGDGGPNSLKLVGSLSRPSAFHANNPNQGSTGHSPIHAV